MRGVETHEIEPLEQPLAGRVVNEAGAVEVRGAIERAARGALVRQRLFEADRS